MADFAASVEEDEELQRSMFSESETRPARRTVDPLNSAGGMFGFMGDMWRPIDLIIGQGMRRAAANTPAGNGTASAYSRLQNKFQELYRILTYLAPSVPNQCRGGPAAPRKTANELDKARAKTRNQIVFVIKNNIIGWYNFGTSDIAQLRNKSNRGFNHHEFGRLLCPASYDWEDANVRAALRSHAATHPVKPYDWPRFFWEDPKTVDSKNFGKGFLRGALLVKAVRCVLFGPQAADPGARIRTNGSRGGNSKPRSVKYKVRTVTCAMIAFSATVVHFSLSSQIIFCPGGTDGRWPYEKFYSILLAFIEQGIQPKARETLLQWWNLQVFGYGQDDEDEDILMSTPDEDSVMGQMILQMRDTLRLEEEADGAGDGAAGAANVATAAASTNAGAVNGANNGGSADAGEGSDPRFYE
ncbi:hypothetical protein BC834DRAFT_976453 [Gloeopeniophorella convolvens]|nr:hypothetical protein BC834DRAFT_976453 [Gloeopeniophorella convolvens]